MDISAAKQPWEEIPTTKFLGKTHWHCRVRLGKPHQAGWAEGPQECEQSQQHQNREENPFAQKHGLYWGTQGWAEEAVHTVMQIHTHIHPLETAQNEGGRWKWSLWVSSDQGWSVLFPSKGIDIDMNSPKPRQKHRVQKEKMLQINRYFMCLLWNTCIKGKREENLFYTSNLKILHSLQVFILEPRLGILYMWPTLYSSLIKINVRRKNRLDKLPHRPFLIFCENYLSSDSQKSQTLHDLLGRLWKPKLLWTSQPWHMGSNFS